MAPAIGIYMPLGSNRFVIIDANDAVMVVQHRWYAKKNGNVWYAVTGPRLGPPIYLHQLMLPVKPGFLADHINGNGLDNRRCNLRYSTNTQNQQNARPRIGSSRFKGVSWHKATNVWRVQIRDNKMIKFVGTFHDEIEAAIAYDAAARLRFGEFARTNFPDQQIASAAE